MNLNNFLSQHKKLFSFYTEGNFLFFVKFIIEVGYLLKNDLFSVNFKLNNQENFSLEKFKF